MDMLHIPVIFLLEVVFGSSAQISGSAVTTVTPGENITLYCDCKLSTGVYITWYRNCSHENQPSLVLATRQMDEINRYELQLLPNFKFVRNISSNTYDLVISNVSVSEEGLYYCGTKQSKLEDKESIVQKYLYSYGNVTKVIVETGSRKPDPCPAPQNCSMCWMLLFSLCPVFTVLSSLCSSLLVYHLCRKRDIQCDGQRSDTGGQTRVEKDEDVCYAALEIRQPSQRPKRKTKSSDYSTYSAINTSRM